MKLWGEFLDGESMNHAWIGVVADPPNWYAIKDWLNEGCRIQTKSWVHCKQFPDECPEGGLTW